MRASAVLAVLSDWLAKGTGIAKRVSFGSSSASSVSPPLGSFQQAKAYDDFESARGGSADSTPINPRALALENDVTFTALGTRVIDGHNCLKIEADAQRQAGEVLFLRGARPEESGDRRSDS